MLTLAFDTSQTTGSVALLEGQRLLACRSWKALASHSSAIAAQTQSVLEDFRLNADQIDLFAVSLGPGSFTGIRVGLSFVKGLALLHQKPVVGISTLSCLANQMEKRESLICPMLDARRNEIYGALYHISPQTDVLPLLEERAQSPDLFLKEIKRSSKQFPSVLFLGSGARKYRLLIEEKLGLPSEFAAEQEDEIRAETVGRLALPRYRSGDYSRGGIELVPNYLRASEAEIQAEKT